MWQENSYDCYFFSCVYLGLELSLHMRECSNYLLGIPELPLLTNLDYFSRERNSCVILPLIVQGDVLFLLLKTEVRPIWGVTLPQSEFKHFFSHSPFSLLFFTSSLIHHPLPTPFHHSSVSSSGWEISQRLRASCSPGTCSPHPAVPGDLGTKQPSQHLTHTELPKSPPQPQSSRSFAHRPCLCMMFSHCYVPINQLDPNLRVFLSFPFFFVSASWTSGLLQLCPKLLYCNKQNSLYVTTFKPNLTCAIKLDLI